MATRKVLSSILLCSFAGNRSSTTAFLLCKSSKISGTPHITVLGMAAQRMGMKTMSAITYFSSAIQKSSTSSFTTPKNLLHVSSSTTRNMRNENGIPIVCGLGDGKTKKGKRLKGTYGKARPKKDKIIERFKEKVEVPPSTPWPLPFNSSNYLNDNLSFQICFVLVWTMLKLKSLIGACRLLVKCSISCSKHLHWIMHLFFKPNNWTMRETCSSSSNDDRRLWPIIRHHPPP